MTYQVLLNVFSVLVAFAMVVFILLQRGAGAAAGSGFGAGASATVFGSRGSASFLTRSTAVLATVFFLLTMGHAMLVNRMDIQGTSADAGIMSGVTAPASDAPVIEPVAPVQSDLPAPPPAREED